MSENFNPRFDSNETERQESAELNVYGHEKFMPEKAKEHVESLVSDFKSHYMGEDYQEIQSVPITSGIDPTVRFIGSHISVLKPYIEDGTTPSPGLFMQQDCLRTRNVDKLLDDGYLPNWGSYFSSIGAITPPERLDDACTTTFDFLEKKLLIKPENIVIRISSKDKDLLEACSHRYSADRMEIDTKNPEYYTHKIGVEGLRGRNFNIALKNPSTEGFSDIGNIIIFETDNKTMGVEIALGTSTILKQLYSLDHVQDCTPVMGLHVENEPIRRKFEDAIISSTVLYREGLRPIGKHNRNRILKQYVRSLSYFRGKSGLSLDNLSKIIKDFENSEFPGSGTSSAEILVEFLGSFENELLYKKDLTEDEKKILDSLRLLK
jgi:hypothetical protein